MPSWPAIWPITSAVAIQLLALYLMYYIDAGQGWEMYPHTRTAVNHFLGMHRYDANSQIKAGSWTADKDDYAYGDVLHRYACVVTAVTILTVFPTVENR